MNDEIIIEGQEILREHLGLVDMTRFIALIKAETLDYSEWQRSLWPDKSVRELSREAMESMRESK